MSVTTINAEALAVLRTHYGRDGTVTRLDGEYDDNFLVSQADGTKSILKLAHADCVEAVADLQCRALRHLAARVPALPLPRVLPTLAGADYCRTTTDDGARVAWLVSYLPGVLLCAAGVRGDALLRELGAAVGTLDRALADFEHPAMHRTLEWQLTRAGERTADCVYLDAQTRALAERTLSDFTTRVLPRLGALPASVIHNDVNDHNVLVATVAGQPAISGLLDFGDMTHQPTICNLAIACTYAAFGQRQPLHALGQVVAGYHGERPLTDPELDVLRDLIMTRLAVSLAIAGRRQQAAPADPYVTISQSAARTLLHRLDGVAPGLVRIAFAQACTRTPVTGADDVRRFLSSAAVKPPIASAAGETMVLDLSVGSSLLGADPSNVERIELTARIDKAMRAHGASVALGRYAEARMLYNDATFGVAADPLAERRTVHLGVDVFCAAGTRVHAPLPGTVHLVANNARRLDYGPLVVLRHRTTAGTTFFTLYGHLDRASVRALTAGQAIVAGETFARIGTPPYNGDWPPHLHLQLILDDLGLGADFPGVCAPSERALWQALSPNPAALLALDPHCVDAAPDPDTLMARRQRHLSGALSLSYARPLHIVRGFGAYLYDSHARAYLDVYNNVAHVGHCHPHVVDAICRQVALLNTNTRYLHDNILNYAERLCGYLPPPLSVCFFVNSASEANELALRLARSHTGRRDMLVAAGAYHGHTTALIEMSPYKYAGPGGAGRADWVHEVAVADDYRGPFKRDDPQAGVRYAAQVAQTLAALPDDHRAAGFIAETLPSVGGQLLLPPGYLEAVYAHVRRHGGVCIADEVQTGFGRLGDWFWGFDGQNVVPDIVVLGKPIGNGFPMGAVVTTREIARSFDNGMEFFATFGGNPVACAAGLAVLDVLERDALPARAHELGAVLLAGLRELQTRHALVGDVRGKGFFLGIELVEDHVTLTPAAAAARFTVERLRERGVLAGIDGPLHNVIKLRPTMVTTAAEVDLLLQALDDALDDAQRRHALPRAGADVGAQLP